MLEGFLFVLMLLFAFQLSLAMYYIYSNSYCPKFELLWLAISLKLF